jgi:hypothetical protein
MVYNIETEDDYREAVKRFLEICDCPGNTEETLELDLLISQMEKYERDSCSGN